ncbi:hypothetical protein EDB92DRAFT_1797303 [Lactarius akahatsu]|uniref:T6SS Phospholipase effector Tle1-like catalytic domain-containing protein n=1 Tax=Lactarius akahatsu TaxID=416441 RepID=A0AAD4LGJ4_9AGAM|nr:hypothetical protein EDB92DRAFT_1797303 [Lactarius akahatsu]
MSRKPRTLVLCFDGTTNEFDDANTNVVKLYSMLRKDKVEDQVTYYQAGIGTYIQPGVVSPLFSWAAEMLDEAIAWYLYQHVMDGYQFLMQNYNVGDKVLLFGFSRGAYTARALAGMLHKVGLLSKDNIEQIPFAYKLYKADDNTDLSQGFKATFCREVPIEFVGVWDTVASVGVIMGKTLPFVDVNTTIRVFRQALALDEVCADDLICRSLSRAQPFTLPLRHMRSFRARACHPSALPFITFPTCKLTSASHSVASHQVPSKLVSPFRVRGNDKSKPVQGAVPGGSDEVFETDMKEVWFVGCHTDVGGSSTPNSVAHSLANIPLRWMMQEIIRADCGILFDFDAFARWDIPITIGRDLYPHVSSQAGGNIVQPTHDQLKAVPAWWLLEIIPTSYTYQNMKDKWVTRWSFHLGRGRYVPPSPLFHESVKTRMQDSKFKYKPRARYTQGTETYVT